ncbi:type I toxin-antitoxin system SymE family toxin [Lachnoclostridium pacaense]|uniref:SymE family type I addiction module toxin n=1 Tax=Enterocloster hominis (ex Hitch et al. 2024) TaxID=1917870 RepID=UPI001D101E70|nr:SymE family type I addiction module toxin [Lachnoclostridium pacaense]MCC2818411.1 type I toxin-antitoxin system SymE family toxin [Lachnoclostridium pacaense]
MAFKENRSMKVYEQSGYRYKSTPTITLKGQWLKNFGFDMGTPINVRCEGGKLTITRTNEVLGGYRDILENQPVSKVAESAD